MVNKETERKHHAAYSLDQVRRLAAEGHVRYAGTRVQMDVGNLGLGMDDVCACLASLTSGHFAHCERYTATGPWHDVYRRAWSSSPGPVDDLYIKLRLARHCLIVDLCSFHRER